VTRSLILIIISIISVKLEPMRKIEFWYSIGSTYTYLSTQRLAQIETENEVVFEWCPFSVRSRMIEMENVPFMAEKKRDKIDYMWRDVQRRANFYGFNAKVPAPYPLKEFDLANKVAILGKDQGWIKEYTILTYKKWFLEHLEPGSEPNLSSTLKEIGLDSDNLIKQAQTDEIEQKYLKNTEMAKNKGIFGSPTFIVENEVFWGDDRCEDAIKWLSK
jgi:2-hydroxychromene-2-carboxylate isomerase